MKYGIIKIIACNLVCHQGCLLPVAKAGEFLSDWQTTDINYAFRTCEKWNLERPTVWNCSICKTEVREIE